jgi:toxin CptA
LRVRLRPSRLFAGLVLLVHGGALIAVQPLALPAWGRLLLSAAILGSLAQTLWSRVAMRSRAAVVQVESSEAGAWTLIRRDGQAREAQLLPDSLVQPWLMVLNFRFREGRGRASVALFADSADSDTQRRLRARLRRGS